MPRHSGGKGAPQKIRITIADVLDQPPTALGEAIAALLRRPDAIDDVEGTSIINEAQHILEVCEAAVSDRNSVNVVLCCKLLQEAMLVSNDLLLHSLDLFSSKPQLMAKLQSLFMDAVVSSLLSAEAQVEILQLVDFLCEGAQTKELCGELFMRSIASLLTEGHRDYRVRRAAATALINLVKCSKSNKQRMESYEFVCVALNDTTDFFFQLQCVELLYRVSRQNKAILEDVKAIPRSVVEAIAKLPNNNTLLDQITELLEAWNAERTPKLILQFPVQRVDVGSKTVCAATKAYFAPEFLIVTLPGTAADNITIPYTFIRSVRLQKDSRVVLRLLEVPPKIADRVTLGKESEDAVTMFLGAVELGELRRSNIHAWINHKREDVLII